MSFTWVSIAAREFPVRLLAQQLADRPCGRACIPSTTAKTSPLYPRKARASCRPSWPYNAIPPGQPTTVTDAQGANTTYTYDNCNRPWYGDRSAGPRHHQDLLRVGRAIHLRHQNPGQLHGLAQEPPGTGSRLSGLHSYRYHAVLQLRPDGPGRLETIDPRRTTPTTAPSTLPRTGLVSQTDGAHATGYDYDQPGRKRFSLTYPVDNTTEMWTYDASGNRLDLQEPRRNHLHVLTTTRRNRCYRYDWSDGVLD